MFLTLAQLTMALLSQGDTSVTLRSCGRPSEPIGTLRASGEVAFLLDRRGRIKVDHIKVLGVTGGTAAGLLSALQRQLPACRFEPESRADRWIQGTVAFNGHSLSLNSSRAVETPPDSVPSLPTIILDKVYDASSTALDELPRVLDCRLIPREEITTRTRMDGPVMTPPSVSNLPPPRKEGEVTLSYVVGPKGRIEENSFMSLGQGDPDLVVSAVTRLQACRFVPGRVAGNRVSVRMTSLERF